MAQGHLDRLSAIDASFLTQESPTTHMHVGAVMIFEGPPPGYQDFLDQVRGRLALVPRYRQKLAFPPFESGRPLWVDDHTFNLEYHVRHAALPAPGSEEQLRKQTARIFSQQLDRTKPLWETWLVQGLEQNRFALISKAHHALVDGVSGVDLTTVLFDLEPIPSTAPPEHDWRPVREPSAVELFSRGVRDVASAPLKLLGQALEAVEHPRPVARRVLDATEAVGEIAWALANPAPKVPLNVEIGPHRRVAWVRDELRRFKAIKDGLGGTVNDVVLASVAGGLRRWLQSRGVATEGLELRALVPVSIRAQDEHGQLGNRIAAMRAPLPVFVEDPVQRLALVRESMSDLKSSKQALGAEVIAGFNNFAPPTLLAQASRLNFSTRLFNLIVTNVPGPQIPLYVLGRELLDVFPIAFLPAKHSLAIAIISYNGKINFGLLADFDAMTDVEQVAGAIGDSVTELAQIAAPAKRSRAKAASAAGSSNGGV